MDRIIEAGGYVSVRTGSAQDANATPIEKMDADRAMDAAICIGCGACVAACPNASAMLFAAAFIPMLAFAHVLHAHTLPCMHRHLSIRILTD